MDCRRKLKGTFGEELENEDVFMPQFVIPRRWHSYNNHSGSIGGPNDISVGGNDGDSSGVVRKRAMFQPLFPRTSSGVRKVEKFDVASGAVLALYDNQSKVR